MNGRTFIRGFILLLLLTGLSGVHPVLAESGIGRQRVGTSAGTFLKIPIDARTSAMSGATTSIISGPSAMFVNPAGLGLEGERAILLSGIQYTADIPMCGSAISWPVHAIRGSLGFAFSGTTTEMDETDEYHPLGTGRTFSYTAWTLGVGVSRALTDKLSFGLTLKAFHEALGAEVGGPTLTPWMMDAGAIYYVGYRDSRIGIAINNFGPDLRPGGKYESNRTEAEIRYGSFSPPTVFRFSFSIDPYVSEHLKTLTAIEVGHLADNQESIRVAGEITLENLLILRGGYDFSADALKFSAGCGLSLNMNSRTYEFDYAFSEGDDFGDVHRWTFIAPW
jgi:hypothetical protein